MAMEAVTSPEATLTAVASRQFDLLLMDLNYTSDTTSGREGIDLVARVQAVDQPAPDHRHDGLGLGRSCRRGDAARGAGLRPEALGQQRSRAHRAGRSRRRAAAAEARRGTSSVSSTEARRIQRKLLPAVMPSVDGWEIAASWQPATGVGGDCYDAIPFGRGRARPVDRRRRRQGNPGRSADVQPAGCGPRVRNRRGAAVGALSASQSHPVRPHRRRSFHQLLLLRRRLRVGPADVCECRALCARARPFRRQRRAAHFRRRGARSFSRGHLRPGTGLDRQRGSRWCFSRMASPRPATRADEEFGEDRLVALAREHRACSAPALQARITETVSAFTAGRFQDDATLIVMAAE